jgi:1,4-dihydroxy-2-naphthoyl-CoA hydrolase
MKIKGSVEFEITEIAPDRVVAEMPIRTGMLNPYGVVNGGAILWLADVTASILIMGKAQPTAGMQGFPLAINLNAHFLGNQRKGSLKSVAILIKRGKTLSVVRTTVTGAEGKLIAEVTTSHLLSK